MPSTTSSPSSEGTGIERSRPLPETPNAVEVLRGRVAWPFLDPTLLDRALAHRSWCAEQGEESNERLEFLGDSVLGLLVTAHIFRTYPLLPEGDLAKLRASVVNSALLAELASELGVDGVCIISHGSSNAVSILNAAKVARDMVEADLVGALRAAIRNVGE